MLFLSRSLNNTHSVAAADIAARNDIRQGPLSNIKAVRNQPATISSPPIKASGIYRHKPLGGIIKWLNGITGCYSNKVVVRQLPDNTSEMINKTDNKGIQHHARYLLQQVSKNGDAAIMSFGGGLHSAALLNKDGKIHYFSFRANQNTHATGRFNNDSLAAKIMHDMYLFRDSLMTFTPDGKPIKQNFCKLSAMNVDAMIACGITSLDKKYHLLNYNCSAPIRDMLLIGSADNSNSDKLSNKVKLSNNRARQMPFNTLKLAFELAKIRQQ